MEKISGILPANSRITTVDLKNSGANRPGTPSFGRNVGLTSAEERLALNAAPSSISQHKDLMNLRNRSTDPQVKIVQDMSDKFFQTRQQEYSRPELPTMGGDIQENEAMLRSLRLGDKVIGDVSHIANADNSVESLSAQDSIEVAADGISAASDDSGDAPILGGKLDVRV